MRTITTLAGILLVLALVAAPAQANHAISSPQDNAVAIAGHGETAAESSIADAEAFNESVKASATAAVSAGQNGEIPSDEAQSIVGAAQGLGEALIGNAQLLYVSTAGEAADVLAVKIDEADQTVQDGQIVANTALGAGFGVAAAGAAAACTAPVPAPPGPGACAAGSIVDETETQATAIAGAATAAAAGLSPEPTLCAVKVGLDGLVVDGGEAIPC